jgi:hypothetical protein
VSSLASLDVVASGTDGLTARVDAIKDDLNDMKDSGTEVAATEIDALETAASAVYDVLSTTCS